MDKNKINKVLPQIINYIENSVEETMTYLSDDVGESIEEKVDKMTDNDEDMMKAYDLGRLHCLRQVKDALIEIDKRITNQH